MGRHRRKNVKRKKSGSGNSGCDENYPTHKSQRRTKEGGHEGGSESDFVNKEGKVNTEECCVSDILSQTHNVLYDEDSVFDSSLDCSTPVLPAVAQAPRSKTNCLGPKTLEGMTDKKDCEQLVEMESDSGVSNPSNTEILSFLVRIEKKISEVDLKLKKLEVLEEKVEQIDKKVESVEKEITSMWAYVKKNGEKYDEKTKHLDERLEGVEFSNNESFEKLESLAKENELLKESLVYVQSQSMRNNLVICNIEERQSEDTESIVRDFLVQKLKIAQDTVNQIQIERAHRIGPLKSGNENGARQARKIVCKFTLFKERELVRKAKKNLYGTSYYIHEQFPQEIIAKRKKLVPKMKDAIKNGNKAWLVYDTLYVNSKPVKDD